MAESTENMLGIFGSAGDVASAQNAQMRNRALEVAKLGRGEAGAYVAGLGGGMLMQGLAGMAGMKTRTEQKQETIQSIMDQTKNLNKNDPKSLYKMSQLAVEGGLTELAIVFEKRGTDLANTLADNAVNKQNADSTTMNAEANKISAESGTTSTLGQTLETSAYIINCNLDDPDTSVASKCRTDSYAHSLNYKRLNEFDKASAINLADDLSIQLGVASTAVDDIAQFDQMLAILPQIYTGFGSEAIATPVARIADFFGVDKTMAGKRELFASNAMDMALGYIAQTKGAISDTEFQAFKDATAGLKKTKVGNDLIIRTARAYATYRKNKGAEMARWSARERKAGRTPTQAQWGTHLEEWSNKEENKVKLPTSSEIAKGLEIPADQLIADTATQIQETEDLLAELEALQAAAGGQ